MDWPRRYGSTLVASLYDVIALERPIYRAGRVAGIAGLGLRPGDVVLDLGCGTGLSFALLQQAVGPRGHVVGLDASASMLARCARRARRRGWTNLTLLHADATTLTPAQLAARLPLRPAELGSPPRRVDAVVAAYALSLMADPEAAWRTVTAVARPGARVAVVDMALPTGRAAALAPLARLACTLGGADPHDHPWTLLERDVTDTCSAAARGGHIQVRTGTLGPT